RGTLHGQHGPVRRRPRGDLRRRAAAGRVRPPGVPPGRRRRREPLPALGYRGSGVDVEATSLQGGVLDVRVRELTIASIDTTALGVDPADLSLQPGDLFNYDTLLEDVRRLARGRSSDIQLEAGVSATGGV